MNPQASVIIANYNSRKFIEACLESLTQSNTVTPAEIIIIDNNSTDGSREWLRSISQGNKKMPLRIIFNDKNVGFARAVNQGVKEAKEKYVVVLNNDVRLAKNWFPIMEKAIFQWVGKKAAAYGGVVLNKDGQRVESLGLRYCLSGRAENIGNGLAWKQAQQKHKQWLEAPHPVFGINAAAAVYYRPAFLALGGFDERFFAYLEDIDLALRLWNSRWKTILVPQARAFHLGGATSRKMGNLRQRMAVRNWYFLLAKNYPGLVLRRWLAAIIMERARNFAYLIRSTRLQQWPVTLKWCFQNLLKLPAIWRQRKPLARLTEAGGKYL